MESNNAPAVVRADPALDAARAFSRFACRLLEDEPQLLAETGCDHPFDSAQMRALLAANWVRTKASSPRR